MSRTKWDVGMESCSLCIPCLACTLLSLHLVSLGFGNAIPASLHNLVNFKSIMHKLCSSRGPGNEARAWLQCMTSGHITQSFICIQDIPTTYIRTYMCVETTGEQWQQNILVEYSALWASGSKPAAIITCFSWMIVWHGSSKILWMSQHLQKQLKYNAGSLAVM